MCRARRQEGRGHGHGQQCGLRAQYSRQLSPSVSRVSWTAASTERSPSMVPASSPQLVDVRLDCLQHSPTNPRTQFDATRHTELTASIEAQGILVPLIVSSVWRPPSHHYPSSEEDVAGRSCRTLQPRYERHQEAGHAHPGSESNQTGSRAAIASITACTLRHYAVRLYHHKMCSSFHVISMTTLNKEGI